MYNFSNTTLHLLIKSSSSFFKATVSASSFPIVWSSVVLFQNYCDSEDETPTMIGVWILRTNFYQNVKEAFVYIAVPLIVLN